MIISVLKQQLILIIKPMFIFPSVYLCIYVFKMIKSEMRFRFLDQRLNFHQLFNLWQFNFKTFQTSRKSQNCLSFYLLASQIQTLADHPRLSHLTHFYLIFPTIFPKNFINCKAALTNQKLKDFHIQFCDIKIANIYLYF